MSKSALKGLVQGMARDLGPKGITVNNVQPGPVNTDMTTETRAIAARRDFLLDGLPLGRFGEPEEFARTNMFLLSDAASHVTAQAWAVDGGMLGTMRV